MHVLVVDDSAVVRQAILEILTREKDISVDVASDPILAEARIQLRRPDVIVLDLEMPRMNGFEFMQRLKVRDSIPVVICSAVAGRGTDHAFRALEEGAVDVVTKPKIGVRDFLAESAVAIVDVVRSAARARRRRSPAPPARVARSAAAAGHVVAIGASTGGTDAITFFLHCMPADCPPILVVQHMPEVFTAAFAQRLNRTCTIEVKEAANGDRVVPGRALIAPGNHHLLLRRNGASYLVEVTNGPLVSRHRPSVDVLFRSVAETAGAHAVGVILTGMGDDGAAGLLEMKRAGATTLAQDEESCVVFGMPKEAIAAGAVDHIASLETLPWLTLQKLRV